ncbi:hypothetical protein H9L39_17847 [Fusarium oxysporum f. sp. albedinis]|nr:hypothetical protein H9L39_17847 [Fusarium oxysporum f. sp. albedinis]
MTIRSMVSITGQYDTKRRYLDSVSDLPAMGSKSALTLATDNGGGKKPTLTVASCLTVVGWLASWTAMLRTQY